MNELDDEPFEIEKQHNIEEKPQINQIQKIYLLNSETTTPKISNKRPKELTSSEKKMKTK